MQKITCRLCHSADLVQVAEFNPMPLVDAYSREPNTQPLYPLGLAQCRWCDHIQLTEVVDPRLLYQSEYLFRTADYPWLVEHYHEYAAMAIECFYPNTVVEIGSNDGTLLKMFADKGCEVMGYDPSNVPASVPTVREFFGPRIVAMEPADMFIANHVFAHIDDLSGVVRAIGDFLRPEGVFIFEAAYGLDLLKHHYFDTIYHEHLDYHTVGPLIPFFKRHGLELFRVEHNDAKGGSIRGFVCHAGAREVELSVTLALSLEVDYGVHKRACFTEFANRLRERASDVKRALGDDQAIGYGASAGPIATMYHLGIADRIRWIVDDSDRRHGMYAPHSNALVRPVDTLYSVRERDLQMQEGRAIILAWRYAEKIRAKHPGVEFIVP